MLIKDLFRFRFITQKNLDEIIDNAATLAVERAKGWVNVNDSGDSDESVDNFKHGFCFGTNVFEQESTGNKEFKRKINGKETTVTEAMFTSAGIDVGVNPENIQTLAKLRLSQDASLWQWINFPVAKSIIESTKRYVIGKGIKIDIPQVDVLKVCQTFWKRNDMEEGTKDDFRDSLLEGELFSLFFANKNENIDVEVESVAYLRRVPSYQIDDIERDPDDYKTLLSYMRVITKNEMDDEKKYYLDISYNNEELTKAGIVLNPNTTKSVYEEGAENARMIYFKYGTTFDERGRPFMECVLRWNRILMDFVYDRGRLNHLRTKVFLIETRTSKGGKVLGSGSGISRMPKGGMKLVESADRKFRMVSPQTGADDAYVDYKMILYIIASGVSMPMHIINMNAENENYASIRKAGHPFIQMIEDFRDSWAEYIRTILRYVIVIAIEKGVLKKSYTFEHFPGESIGEVTDLIKMRLEQGIPTDKIIEEADLFKKEQITINTVDIPINVVFPELSEEDAKAQAETLEIQLRNFLVSQKTAIQRTGGNVDAELIQMEIEKKKRMDDEDEFVRKQDEFKDKDFEN